ncbi:MAG: hypothetical protein CMH48_07695 [Muricauda sp.]|nr:hypothetical protein [Allomuricauda sp.]MAU26786.1 hypothetical protein [Allomuricauda sp.]MBC30715.1 hypothetical protein [Allomuricauda sp.]|tara:strand:- start:83026 stop:84294 length:1269 start_codon:yes stop_codon:yes gene_type:complete
MKWFKKIKAGALQFVLFIGAIVALLLLAFVLVSYSHNLFLKKTDVLVEIIQAVDSGLEYSFTQNMVEGQELNVPIKSDLGISVSVEKKYWGVMEIRKTKARKGKLNFEKLGFVGHADENRAALYLQDRQRPLVLAGNARITGTAHLPEQGVKTGNISGNGYYASQLIYGMEKRSGELLPAFDEEVNQQIVKLTSDGFEPQGEEILFKVGMVLKNSFKEPTKVIKGSHILLERVELSGNIIIWATHKISVGATSKLHDVILLAPKIEVERFSKGNFQALAKESITVGKDCELDYPTILYVRQSEPKKEDSRDLEPYISINSNSNIKGMVIYGHEGEETNRFKPDIRIDDNASVTGEVHCSGNLELKGYVKGSVTTGGFVALENGNIYQNHIYNGSINSMLLPIEFAGIKYEAKPLNQVAKWLY